MPAKKSSDAAKMPQTQEALDLFTVKRKQGKKSGQYEGVSIRMGNASYTRRKVAGDYVSPGDGGF